MFLTRSLRTWPGRRLAVLAAVLALLIAGSAYWFWDWYRLDRTYSRAKEALVRHRFAEAKALFEECAQSKPDDGEVLFYLARTARRSDDIGGANHYLSRAERIRDVPEFTQLERKLLRFQVGAGKEFESDLWTFVDNN